MPGPPPGAIQIEGLEEFQRAARRSTDLELPKRLGEAHREIGKLVISRLQPSPNPAAVGTGAGASVRPSATKREVLLRVGGAHRRGHSPEMQWGKRRVLRVGRSAPKRPYIKETAERNRAEIGTAYLEAISRAMGSAFADTDP